MHLGLSVSRIGHSFLKPVPPPTPTPLQPQLQHKASPLHTPHLFRMPTFSPWFATAVPGLHTTLCRPVSPYLIVPLSASDPFPSSLLPHSLRRLPFWPCHLSLFLLPVPFMHPASPVCLLQGSIKLQAILDPMPFCTSLPRSDRIRELLLCDSQGGLVPVGHDSHCRKD